jgi:hypothetical protein
MESMASRLSDPEVYRKGESIPELVKAHGEAKKRVEALTAEWETLAQKVEEAEAASRLSPAPNEPGIL